jgi:hypothetical protein
MKCPYCGSLEFTLSFNEEDFQGFEGEVEGYCEHCHAKFKVEMRLIPKRCKRNLKLDITKAKP